jgi:hypothetical protein
MQKKIIGRKDIVSFPDFGLSGVPVKIDTGAYSSSLHCESVELRTVDGKEVLDVVFLDKSMPMFTGEIKRFERFKRKTVKSSNGIAEERFFISGRVQLFGEAIETQFSLTERHGLRNPVLLGRKLLKKRFLVDTSLVNCSFKHGQAAN